MEFNNTSPEEKLQKYMEYNEAPDIRLGGIEYIPNEMPDNNIDFTKMPETNITSLMPPFMPIKLKSEKSVAKTGIEDIEVPPAADPIQVWAQAANSYKNTFNKPTEGNLKKEIAKVESDGMGGYLADNPTSSAVGKYQFVWSIWGDAISRQTGIKDPESFKRNPDAQEKFFDFYKKTTLEPQLQIIKEEFPDTGFSDTDIMKLLHFRGLGRKDKSDKGLRALLSKGKLGDKLESNNLTATEYIARSKQK